MMKLFIYTETVPTHDITNELLDNIVSLIALDIPSTICIKVLIQCS